MNFRDKKLISLLLALSLVFSSHVSLLAAGLGAEVFNGAGANVSTTSNTSSTQPTTGAQNLLKDSVTLLPGTPELSVEPDNTVSVDKIEEAVLNSLRFMKDNKTYAVKDGAIYDLSGYTKKGEGITTDCISVNLISIRKAGAPVSDAKENFIKKGDTFISGAKGNQLVVYSVTLNTGVFPNVKCEKAQSEIFLKTWLSGTVSSQRVTFGNGKFSLYVEYDAAVKYRNKKVTATSHHLVSATNAVSGTVDYAIGVAVRLEMVSGNSWHPMEGLSYDKYFWKDDTGITLKRPKVYNAKKIAGWNDENFAPYFMIPMTYKKKVMENDKLSVSDKQALKEALKTTKFYFTIEPKRLSTDLITYSKYEPDKFYVKKVTYDSGRNTLKGNIRYRSYKTKKTMLNVRKLKNANKLKITSKSAYSSKPKGKVDAYFELSGDGKAVTLRGVNGYFGTAYIDQHLNFK